MLLRTHLAITICFVFLFIDLIENKLIFIFISLFSTAMPDIDIKYSKLGKNLFFRPFQFFVEHRGILHSFIFLVLITFILFSIFENKEISLAFFAGYSLHLFADSFTKKGIKPLYPFNWRINGNIVSGKKIDFLIFFLFAIIDLGLIFNYLFNIYLLAK